MEMLFPNTTLLQLYACSTKHLITIFLTSTLYPVLFITKPLRMLDFFPERRLKQVRIALFAKSKSAVRYLGPIVIKRRHFIFFLIYLLTYAEK